VFNSHIFIGLNVKYMQFIRNRDYFVIDKCTCFTNVMTGRPLSLCHCVIVNVVNCITYANLEVFRSFPRNLLLLFEHTLNVRK
jgi:hypothetical protein